MMQFHKVAFYTLGCKLNFSETSTIARSFEDAGYARVDFNDDPDIFVINTCSVTDNADRKCRQIVNKARRINPESFIIIIGCYAQLKPQEISEIPGVNLVLGAQEKFNVLEHLENADTATTGKVEATEIKATKEFVPSYSIGDRTRTFLKVQDGCNYFCAFCTIPLARGRSRSASVAETVKQAEKASREGAKEIVLTGVNIGDFGTHNGESFFDLIKELDKVEGISRYRISSIEPNLLSDEIIEFCSKSEKFVPHFHIPLQSGSDAILKKMRRRYLTDLYANRVRRIKELMPQSCIGVDVIVGFPGESEEEFEKTYNFLKDLDISYLHVFTYSERPNTTALRIDDVVPMEIRQKRSKMLRILSSKKKRAFYESQQGRVEKVLFEGDDNEGVMHGFTENYVKVKTPFDPELINTEMTVQLEELDRDGVMKITTAEAVEI
ncbi:tRNA (N(6)-L-threonylcarbamoyladenosine(37)-C(2))-methylthiotransferase MtaB [Halocola ammonii]